MKNSPPKPQPSPAAKNKTSIYRWLWGLPIIIYLSIPQLPLFIHHPITREASINRWLSPSAQYPDRLLKQNIADNVDVHCFITADGKAQSCHVTKGRYVEINDAALAFLNTAVFYPALKNDRPVPDPNYILHLSFSTD